MTDGINPPACTHRLRLSREAAADCRKLLASIMIYLDNNATTPLDPEVRAAMEPYWSDTFGNPASPHASGRAARKAVEDARELVAELLGAQPDEVIFTSGGTEANNLAILGLAGEKPAHAVVSPIEHPCVSECFDWLERRGWAISRLEVDAHGLVDPVELSASLRPETRLVSVMLANNDTGVIEPVAELARKAAEHGVALHSDAVQAAGKIEIDFHQLATASLALSAHKFHGPKGVGALLVRRGISLEPLLHGGGQQSRLRPGTEPVALIVGLAEALRIACRRHDDRVARLCRLRDRLEAGVQAALGSVIRNGPAEPRLPNTSNLAFPGLESEELLLHLDLEGVACSAGSACASGSIERSPTLLAMQLPDAVAAGALRFSVGDRNTVDEIDEAIDRIVRVVRRLRARTTTV